MANNTREEIENRVYNLLWETDLSNEYSPSVVQDAINRWVKDICSWKIVRLFPDEKWSKVIRTRRLTFLEQRTPIKLFPSENTTAAANIWDTELLLDTTNFLAATVEDPKYVYANGNIISYTWKTATQLEGVTWIAIELEEGTRIQQLFLIDNVNIYKPYDLILQTENRWPVECVQVEEWSTLNGCYYSIINQWESRLLLIRFSSVYYSYDFGIYRIRYIQKSSDLATADSEVILPWTQWVSTVAPLVAGELLYNTEETEFGMEKLNVWYRNLIQFFNWLNPQVEDGIQTIGRDGVWFWSAIWPNNSLSPRYWTDESW